MTMAFAQNSSILHWAVHQPITFSHLWSPTKRHFEPVTEELWLHLSCHFQHTCTNVHKSLSNKII